MDYADILTPSQNTGPEIEDRHIANSRGTTPRADMIASLSVMRSTGHESSSLGLKLNAVRRDCRPANVEADEPLEGFEHVVPVANGIWAMDEDRLPGFASADEVGNEAVFRPVPSCDDIAGAGPWRWRRGVR